MSKEEQKSTIKAVAIVVVASIIIQILTAFVKPVLTEDVKVNQIQSNTRRIDKIETESKEFVKRIDNDLSHKDIVDATKENAAEIKKIQSQQYTEQKYIMDKLENINNNILKLSERIPK